MFENIECEWPMFFAYLMIDGLFNNKMEQVCRVKITCNYNLCDKPRGLSRPTLQSTLLWSLLTTSGLLFISGLCDEKTPKCMPTLNVFIVKKDIYMCLMYRYIPNLSFLPFVWCPHT